MPAVYPGEEERGGERNMKDKPASFIFISSPGEERRSAADGESPAADPRMKKNSNILLL